LLELPLSLVSVSLGTALLPTLASMWSQNEKMKMSETANFYLRLNLFIGIPAAIGLYMLAFPIIELIFQHGKFTTEDAMATSKVLEIYALILLPVSGVRVLAPAYYAVKNTWYPALVSGFALMVHVMVAPWLMKFYGLQGLVFSTFLSGSINFLLLLGSFSGMVTFFNWKYFVVQVVKFIIPAAALALSLTLYPIWRSFMGEGLMAQILSLGISIGLAIFVYFAISWLLRLEESKATTSRVFNKIRRRFTGP
jgi:putative peptidoglycan lipid II flippase